MTTQLSLGVKSASERLFSLAVNVYELQNLGVIDHPLFCSLASQAGRVLGEIYGRRFVRRDTIKLQRQWIAGNNYDVVKEVNPSNLSDYEVHCATCDTVFFASQHQRKKMAAERPVYCGRECYPKTTKQQRVSQLP